MLVASFSAVELGKMHYRHLEKSKTEALKKHKGNYDAIMSWWIDNIHLQYWKICRPNPTKILETDASLQGWGAKLGKQKTGGRWTTVEKQDHINVLELLAIFYALKAFKQDLEGLNIKVLCDNTTAVNYVNNMGGIVSEKGDSVSLKIWEWCVQHDIWLSCSHIAGKLNLEANRESRVFKDNLEWELDGNIFKHICNTWGVPDIDLFASRLNAKIPRYCSWKPDPECECVDAFTFAWNATCNLFYAFPPFSLEMCAEDKESHGQRHHCGSIVAHTTLVHKGLLKLPHQDVQHPLQQTLCLVDCKVSGRTSDTEDFERKLPIFSCNLGRPGTKKQYNTHIKRWFQYCSERETSPILPTLETVVEFLISQYSKGLGYESLNKARGALSALGLQFDGFRVGNHPLII
ncbi:LOW QUALITY PROTEIN: hypothetical protein MAR_036707 [Mya arenaria]|uniref:Reverse transcriptase RNase H-like domain-containing protein n=1 Tax=Mya arenaria TaxID=6604 RepID=A0ABY7FLF8_MYAAR|nr:LOW QUALITY PROTEIN: hypothetical protein MAR_036707 [Mya arenaria]